MVPALAFGGVSPDSYALDLDLGEGFGGGRDLVQVSVLLRGLIG